MNTKTLNYYNENAKDFISNTINVSFTHAQDVFLSKLNKDAYILDFGCGSGRDTKYFLSQGYRVDAIDGSKELCIYASEYTGIKVKQMYFQELNKKDVYDGIWACASILHLNKEELKMVIFKMIDALKSNGIIYTSFKYGDFEGIRNNRYFTDFTLDSFSEYIADIQNIQVIDNWITNDARPDRGKEKWLNIIIQKK